MKAFAQLRKPLLSFRDISLHRPVLYGFAALMILYCHMNFERPAGAIFAPLRWLRSSGACGVDLFVLLTGMGLYRSMGHSSVGRFYVRRLVRILPASIIVMFIYHGLSGSGLRTLIEACLLFPVWFGGPGMWFVPFILTVYLAYPWIYRLQRSDRAPRHALWWLFAASLAFSAFTCYCVPGLRTYLRFAIDRVPIFLLGCILAPMLEEDASIPWWIAPTSLAIYALLACDYYIRGRSDHFVISLSFLFLAIFLAMALTWLARLLTHGALRFFYRGLALCGGVSLEIYLIYSRLAAMLQRTELFTSGSISLLKLEVTAAGLTLLLAMALNRFCKYLTDQWNAVRIP